MSESSILQRTLLKIGALPNFRCWRINAGLAWAGRPIRLIAGQVVRAEKGDVLLKQARPIKLGPPGMSDILAIRAIRITPEMVGQTFGLLVALEAKTDAGKQSPEQVVFKDVIEKHGGKYAIFRSPEEALAIIASLGNSIAQQKD